MADGDYEFAACGNQCAQAGKDKVIALVTSFDEEEPAIISWTKGAPTVTLLYHFGK